MKDTLVVMIGNARGGEECWQSFYKHVLVPYRSDLALCFGSSDHRCSLHDKAKYLWEMEEYKDWKDYYEDKLNGFWEKSFLLGSSHGLAGGLGGNSGSGAIIFAFRHFLKSNYLDVLKKYKTIILTRSDQFYIKDHPVITEKGFYVVEGANCGGITDRHCLFDSSLAEKVLGVVEYMDSEKGFNSLSEIEKLNPEKTLLRYYNHAGLVPKRFKRYNFGVATPNDMTRWKKAEKHFKGNMYIKYPHEYFVANRNIKS